MHYSSDSVSRRNLLRGIAAGAAATGIAVEGAGAADPQEYIVGTGTQAATDRATERAASVARVHDFGDIGNAVAGKFPEEARTALANRPDVRYVEPNGTMYAVGETVPWGVDRVDADLAHDDGATGDGADVAIIDTGIDSDHPDLEANLGAGKAINACDGTCSTGTCNEPWDDDHGHGTHCAGIAAAADNAADVVGVSCDATLHAVKVLTCDGGGSYSDVAAGVEHVADQGWDVASMSLGGVNGSATLRDACQYAYSKGVLIVAAAGNDGPCTDCVLYPAAYDSVVAVGATESDDSLAYYSCTGPEVELVAPGTNILSTVPGGTEHKSGTSMATPHVAGAAGTVMADGTSNESARSTLHSSAEDIGLADNESGYGLLDAEAAASGSSESGSGDSTAPTAPSNLTATDVTSSSVDLSWDASSDSGTGVDHYNVYVDGSKWSEATGTATTVTGLSASTSYDMYVTAVDGAGNESSTSNTVTVTTTERVGEVGQVSIGQPDTDTWHAVSFQNTYADPVVVMKPVQFDGPHPCHVRLRNVGSDGFEFQIEEWQYLDGSHTQETISYLVVEAGTHTLSDGRTVEAGTTSANHDFASVSFAASFGSTPVVLSQSQTLHGWQPVVSRNRRVSTDGFDVCVQEEEANGWHNSETVGYVAIEPGSSSGGLAGEAGTTGTTVTHDWHALSFGQSYDSSPLFLADMQTCMGGNTAGLRYRNLDGSGVEVFVEEEQSADDETWHAEEDVGYVVFDDAGSL